MADTMSAKSGRQGKLGRGALGLGGFSPGMAGKVS